MPIDSQLAQMLLETFKTELQELHQSLTESLISLETVASEELQETLKTLFRYSHNMKGAAASVGIEPIAQIAHRLEDLFSDWREKNHIPDKKQITACLEVVDNILQVMEAHSNQESVNIADYLAPLEGKKAIHKTNETTTNSDYIKISLKQIERASAKGNELITYRLKLSKWFSLINQSVKELSQLNIDSPSLKELTTLSADSGQFYSEFSRSIHALQEEFKNMRMLPITNILLPLARTVHDVAASLNKSVELQIHGGDVELDKAVLDALRDPLQHLIRNAIDHGIESDDERRALNKPIPAKILIQVSQSSGKIKLKFSDDGRGINLEKIRQHAIATNLYNPDYDDNQLLELIFHSGFSLQKEVSQFSGRGVGLDAVKNDILNIKGTITVETELGKGSSFSLTLPLTLATTRGVFFKVNEHIFMLPTLSLNALYEITPDLLKQVDNQYIFIANNKPVPIKLFSQLLDIKTPDISLNNYYGLFIDHPGNPFILLVDLILDERDCVVKPLPFPYSKLEHYIGVTLTADNELVLVFEPLKLVQMAASQGASGVKPFNQDELKSEIKKSILVVDDSLTTRCLCTSALESAGYKTRSAVNGKNAWQLLQTDEFDCVVTDVLMPEMDGFELTKLIKTDRKYAHIPVIIISLLDSKKDKQKGLDAGADAFLVKKEFDTRTLIERIETLL